MKDEIKKILDNLKYTAKKHTIQVLENGGKIEHCPQEVATELRLNTYSANILLDYITNLQEENEKLKKLKNYYREKFISNFCVNNRAIKCIEDFLCTEEYIKSDPEATANNYVELLNILKSEMQENLYKYTSEKGFRLVGDEDVKD